MINIPDKNKLLKNFSYCNNWEERYLYIIELGNLLPPLPLEMHTSDYLVAGCQSQVWIVMTIDNNGQIQLRGDSDAAIVKGLIAMVFILYQGMTPNQVITYDAWSFFDKLLLNKHLTPSRSHGLGAMIRSIRDMAITKLK